jgi:hypothetical protein
MAKLSTILDQIDAGSMLLASPHLGDHPGCQRHICSRNSWVSGSVENTAVAFIPRVSRTL